MKKVVLTFLVAPCCYNITGGRKHTCSILRKLLIALGAISVINTVIAAVMRVLNQR